MLLQLLPYSDQAPKLSRSHLILRHYQDRLQDTQLLKVLRLLQGLYATCLLPPHHSCSWMIHGLQLQWDPAGVPVASCLLRAAHQLHPGQMLWLHVAHPDILPPVAQAEEKFSMPGLMMLLHARGNIFCRLPFLIRWQVYMQAACQLSSNH